MPELTLHQRLRRQHATVFRSQKRFKIVVAGRRWGKTWLALWCLVVFVVRGHGTPAPFDAPRKLVAIGPYRYIRNPMYVGGGLALLGFGLLQTSPSIVLFVPVWWLLFHVMVLVYEEPVLRAKFGSDYDDYCRRIPRWIPSLRSPPATSRAWPEG